MEVGTENFIQQEILKNRKETLQSFPQKKKYFEKYDNYGMISKSAAALGASGHTCLSASTEHARENAEQPRAQTLWGLIGKQVALAPF